MLILFQEFKYFFNISLRKRKVPKAWKNAFVIPIPKIPNPTRVSDLRAISLLPTPGKILERFVHRDLMYRLTENDLLSHCQFGFRLGYSTTDAIFTLVDDIGNNMNNNKLTLTTNIDFSKVFDTLDHNKLIKRLTNLGLTDNTISWFESYLSDRAQQTLANGLSSDEAPIKTGVPQGSILGPLLFIIYVNGLTATTKSSQVIMYAYDTVVYSPVDRHPTNEQLLNYQMDLNALHN